MCGSVHVSGLLDLVAGWMHDGKSMSTSLGCSVRLDCLIFFLTDCFSAYASSCSFLRNRSLSRPRYKFPEIFEIFRSF